MSPSASTPGVSRPIIPTTSPRAVRCSRAMKGARAHRARTRRVAGFGARCGHALPAHTVGGLAGGAGRCAGQAEGPARILSQAAFSPVGEIRERLRHRLMSVQRVTIHTDGACSGNPGPGGWGAILSFGDHEKE